MTILSRSVQSHQRFLIITNNDNDPQRVHEVLHLGRAPPHLPPRRPHLCHRRRALLGHEGDIVILQCWNMRHLRHMTRELFFFTFVIIAGLFLVISTVHHIKCSED